VSAPLEVTRQKPTPQEPATAALKSHCWICGGQRVELVKPSNVGQLTSQSFSITDSHYGMTGAIYRCSDCRFLQCSELSGVLPFYEELVDSAYDAGRPERSIQARKILEVVRKLQPGGRLLDIGAGSGFLVEQAVQMGYQAEGIEPSGWLQKMAAQRGLPVHLGTFPHPAVSRQFDVITLIDVVEHVSEPLALLRNIAASLAPNGTAIVVTPDVNSIAARVLGWKWWHFRVAHIGYFNKRNLFLALDRAGLQPVLVRRPAWYFTAEYVWERTHRYLPRFLRVAPPRFLTGRVIPVNLRDSWLVACKRKDAAREPTTNHPR
jgi:SAM-dependent methyltransferase